MQLDSYRRHSSLASRQTTSVAATAAETTAAKPVQMPCQYSRCAKPVTFKTEDGVEMETWFSVRRDNVRNMRRMVKRVVLYMALIEAIRLGPDNLVFAGQKGYPERGSEDFGIAYRASYLLSWVYLCIFAIVWKPLFSWWVSPSSSKTDSGSEENVDKVAAFLKQLNMFLLPLSIGLSLLEYVYYAVSTFIYIDARPIDSRSMPKNTQKNWLARLMLLVGILTSVTLGYGMFDTLAEYNLAHVKHLEYMIIVLPIQMSLGILLGSAMQWRMEKRMERKALAVKAVEVGTVDEKQALLLV